LQLQENERVWRGKPSLQAIYASYFKRMFQYCSSGATLEVGAGFGSLRDSGYEVVSSDIVHMPGIDIISDAHALPFATASFTNIVAVDVFHHLERPVRFLREASRVLVPNGRLVMLEPGITPVSSWFYRNFHREPVDMSVDMLIDGPLDNSRDPFAGNQAMGTVLATRFKEKLPLVVSGMHIREYQWLGSLAFPLSGGFQEWNLVPKPITRPVLAFEKLIDSFLGRWLAFRILLVLDRSGVCNH